MRAYVKRAKTLTTLRYDLYLELGGYRLYNPTATLTQPPTLNPNPGFSLTSWKPSPNPTPNPNPTPYP